MSSFDTASVKTEQTSVSDEKQLVPAEDGINEFAKFYTNCCPGRFLRTTNWILLIILLISSIYGITTTTYWHDSIREIWPRMPFAVAICLALMAISKFCRRCKMNAGTVGIMDFCFALITMVTMLTVAIFYGVHTVDLYSHFYPKMFGQNLTTATLAELTDMDEPYNRIPPLQRPYHYDPRYLDEDTTAAAPLSTTTTTTTERPFSEYAIRQMETRRRMIIAQLANAPTNMILAILVIIVNLFVAISIWIGIKRSNIWASNHRELNPFCSEFDAKYAQFYPYGLVNAAFWIIPAMGVLLCCFTGVFFRSAALLITSLITFGISFGAFLHYCRETKIRGGAEMTKTPAEGAGTASGLPKLMQMCIMNQALSVVGLFYYLIAGTNFPYYVPDAVKALFMAGIVVSSIQLLLLMVLMCRSGGICSSAGGAYFGIPQISIQILVNVNRKAAADTEQDEKKLEPKTDEKKIGENLV